MCFNITQIKDKQGLDMVDALLLKTGLTRDPLLEYTCGIFDEEYRLCATGSYYQNTLRCIAVDDDFRGNGLMNMLISHLCEEQARLKRTHLFLYTKPMSSKFFGDLGFYEIAHTDSVAFMENKRNGFDTWLKNFDTTDRTLKTACVVMNANPFTLGHRYLLEYACNNADTVHLFVLSENHGPISPDVRKHIVELSVQDLPKIILHDSGPYIISSATFPSYFLQQNQQVSKVQAELDIAIFIQIAHRLNIDTRFVGSEPTSRVSQIYNSVMANMLPQNNIKFIELPRLKIGNQYVSASTVRQAIHDGNMELAQRLMLPRAWQYITSTDCTATIDAIRNTEQLIHH